MAGEAVRPETGHKIVERLVSRATRLYSLPAVAARVLELTNDPQVAAADLKACIENDPALTTKILRVVNSSLFGLRREVSDLNQALALLGMKPLKLLVLGFSLPAGLFAGVGATTLGWYWRRTLTKAVAAREICETIWRRPGDECFIAGLLQDLGLLLLIQEVGAPYIDFLEKVRQRGYDLLALETASMGFDHAALSAALLTHWGLPEVLIEAVRWRPAEADGGPAEPHLGTTGSIVHLAEWIARLLADGRAESLGQLLSIGRREHRLSPEQLGALVEVLEGKVQSLADVLSLELLHTEGYQELLAEAHARLSDVAASTAADMLHREQAGTDASCATATLSNEMRCLGAATARLTPRPREPAAEHEAAPSAPATAGVERLVTAPALPREEHAASAEGDWNLLRQLADAVATSRRLRCPLSLLLVELGETEELVLHHGLPGFHHVRTVAEKACRTVDHGRATCIPYGGAGFAVILVDCDRQLAVRLGNQIVDRVARCTVGGPAAKHPTLGIGVGAATVCLPPKNFPAKDLLVAANRCLYGSHTCGGGVVKSIEIY